MKRYWELLGSETVFSDRIMKVRHDRYHFLPNDVLRDFTVLEFADWVNLIPITPDGMVVMIRQYRLGTRRETLEIPGGLISEHDPDPLAAAAREMTEETGYHSDEIIHIGTVEPNPAIQNNRCYTFLALNTKPISGQNLDPTEAIDVELVRRQDIAGLIRSSRITHSLVIAAFAHLMLYERNGLH